MSQQALGRKRGCGGRKVGGNEKEKDWVWTLGGIET